MKSALASIVVFSFLSAASAHASDLPWTEPTSEDDMMEFSASSLMLSDDELEHERGMFIASPILSSSQFANLAGNSVNGGATGNNQIQDGAFNSASGIISVILNSGNNVVVQNSTIVNLNLL
jgi:hypothetical protein